MAGFKSAYPTGTPPRPLTRPPRVNCVRLGGRRLVAHRQQRISQSPFQGCAAARLGQERGPTTTLSTASEIALYPISDYPYNQNIIEQANTGFHVAQGAGQSPHHAR